MENDNTVSLKELRENFYRCRDFELNNLLQRSIFLTTFIGFIAVGYGTLFTNYFTNENCRLTCIQYHLYSLIISLVGISLAAIWMLMSKGGKYWFDTLESAIYKAVQS